MWFSFLIAVLCGLGRTMVAWYFLPDKLWHDFFTNLDIQSRLNAEIVCKRFYRLVSYDNVRVQISSENIALFQSWMLHRRLVKPVKYLQINLTVKRWASAQFLRDFRNNAWFSEHPINLIDQLGGQDNILSLFEDIRSGHYANLVGLTLRHVNTRVVCALDDAVWNGLPHLTAFSMTNNSGMAYPDYWPCAQAYKDSMFQTLPPTLLHLSLDTMYFKSFRKLLVCTPLLETLAFRCVYGIDDETLPPLVNLKKLRYTAMKACNLIHMLALSAPNIESISFCGTHLNNVDVHDFCYLRKLKSISLNCLRAPVHEILLAINEQITTVFLECTIFICPNGLEVTARKPCACIGSRLVSLKHFKCLSAYAISGGLEHMEVFCMDDTHTQDEVDEQQSSVEMVDSTDRTVLVREEL